jgi:hypothetical protein
MSTQSPPQHSGNSGQKNEALRNLLVEELQDLYQAENQLVKAIPKMTEAAHDPQPTHGLDQHLEQSKEHARRLEQAFKILGYETKARTFKGIKGIVEEGVWEIKHGRYKHTFAADLALLRRPTKWGAMKSPDTVALGLWQSRSASRTWQLFFARQKMKRKWWTLY